MRYVSFLFVCLGCVALTACGGMRSVALPVRGVAPLNANATKESVPVDVRIHPLSGEARFRAASVDQLWTDAAQVLGAELLAPPSTITVFPGAAEDPQVVHALELPGSTRFIGVLAMYQGADAQDRRAVVVSIKEAEKYGLTFSGYGVVLAVPKAAKPAAAPIKP